MTLPYQKPGLTMQLGNAGDPELVKALQHDLRALGYLHHGIDGAFGSGTQSAIRSLQYDLLNNRGASRQNDGNAPVAIADFNGPGQAGGGQAVTTVTGVLNQDLAACIDRMLAASNLTKLPAAEDAAAENAKALQAIRNIVSAKAPTPFIAAMIIQESGAMHFRVPGKKDGDNFVVVGLDRGNGNEPDQITSRGYGIGQYTIFHHPPRAEEVADFILDPARNVQKAFRELRDKFDNFVMGANGADDRKAEHPLQALRLCKYQPSDPLYMRDCAACAAAAAKVDIRSGTPHYTGATTSYHTDQYYKSADYDDVPNRADFACDWPYAARRYNGGGNDSYHYQTRILRNLLAEPNSSGA